MVCVILYICVTFKGGHFQCGDGI